MKPRKQDLIVTCCENTVKIRLRTVIITMLRTLITFAVAIFRIMMVTTVLSTFGKGIMVYGLWFGYVIGIIGIIYVIEPWLLEILRWYE